MEIWITPQNVRPRLRERRASKSVGFIPTQGGLHAGHLAQIQRAKAECGLVIVSALPHPQIPSPFLPTNYRESDAALATQAGADILFAPSPAEVFPEGATTRITLEGPLTQELEGRFLPHYFTAFATGLIKQLCLIYPDRIYLSEKSYQQVQVARRLIQDLGLPVSVVAVPPSREKDGLPVSRQALALSPDDRKKARVLPYLMATAQDLLDTTTPESQTDKAGVLIHWLATLLQSSQPEVVADYIALVDPETFEPLDEITGRALIAIALRIGEARLTDSRLLRRR